jgi:hypothetical protein
MEAVQLAPPSARRVWPALCLRQRLRSLEELFPDLQYRGASRLIGRVQLTKALNLILCAISHAHVLQLIERGEL